MVLVPLALAAGPGGLMDLPVLGDIPAWFCGGDDQTFLNGAAVILGLFY